MRVEGVRPAVSVEPVKGANDQPAQGLSGSQAKAGKERAQKEAAVSMKAVNSAIDQLNKTMETYSTELRFTLHKKSGEYMVKVINTTDNSVIREIPPEKVLNMIAQFKEMLGLIVDKFI